MYTYTLIMSFETFPVSVIIIYQYMSGTYRLFHIWRIKYNNIMFCYQFSSLWRGIIRSYNHTVINWSWKIDVSTRAAANRMVQFQYCCAVHLSFRLIESGVSYSTRETRYKYIQMFLNILNFSRNGSFIIRRFRLPYRLFLKLKILTIQSTYKCKKKD